MPKDSSSSLMTLGLLSVGGYFVYEYFFANAPTGCSIDGGPGTGTLPCAAPVTGNSTTGSTSTDGTQQASIVAGDERRAPGYAASRLSWLDSTDSGIVDDLNTPGNVHTVRGQPISPHGGDYYALNSSLAGLGSIFDGGGTDASGGSCTPGWDSGCTPDTNVATAAPGDIGVDYAVANSFLNANALASVKTGLAAVPTLAWVAGSALLFLVVAGSGGRR